MYPVASPPLSSPFLKRSVSSESGTSKPGNNSITILHEGPNVLIRSYTYAVPPKFPVNQELESGTSQDSGKL